MSKTLEEIIRIIDNAQKISSESDEKSLKSLKKKWDTAEVELKASPEDAAKKTTRDSCKSIYDKRRSEIVRIIKDKVNKERESGNLELYSEEVKKRREARKLADLEAKMIKLQGEVDVLGLEIADVDAQIGQVRLGVSVPASQASATGGTASGGSTTGGSGSSTSSDT